MKLSIRNPGKVTVEMLTAGHISPDRGDDGIPFQELPGGFWTFWHPGPNPDQSRQIDGLLAAEMRRRVELGHGTWKEIAVLYGFSEELSETVYPFCTSDTRFKLACERLAIPLVEALRSEDQYRVADIMDVIEEREWHINWLNRREDQDGQQPQEG